MNYCKKNINKKVAVFGGAFDPVTNGHLQSFAEIINSMHYDEIWIVPSGKRLDKPRMTKPLDRLIMLHLAVNTYYTSDFPIKILDIEIYREKPLATYDLLCYLRNEYKDCDFTFVIGSDWLQPGTDLRMWESQDPNDETKTIVTGDKLINEFDFIVLYRPGYGIKDLKSFGPRFRMLKLPYNMEYINTKVSSSELRNRMEKNLILIEGLLPRAVLDFIKRNNIYKKN